MTQREADSRLAQRETEKYAARCLYFNIFSRVETEVLIN